MYADVFRHIVKLIDRVCSRIVHLYEKLSHNVLAKLNINGNHFVAVVCRNNLVCVLCTCVPGLREEYNILL